MLSQGQVGKITIIQRSDGRIQLTMRTPQGEAQLIGSHLLVAAGRIPNTEALTPEVAGIAGSRSWVSRQPLSSANITP
jgi:pyruvate/2-oxoglutarate dehydrogenase complex dihydrolipoamide dehydrogenase (E3) component